MRLRPGDWIAAALGVLLSGPAGLAAAGIAQTLAGPDVRPGLCVLAEPGDDTLASEIRSNGKYIVHVLTRDASKAADIRKQVHANGLDGRVTVERHDLGALPFADDLVNAVVVADERLFGAGGLTVREILRVMAPYGTAFLKGLSAEAAAGELQSIGPEAASVSVAEGWTRIDKPYPRDMDEWPRAWHDNGNSNVSRDRRTGPPEGIRWIAGEQEWTSAWNGVCSYASIPRFTSAGGRIFHTFPHSILIPKEQREATILECRDAFNGLLLWSRSFKDEAVVRVAARDQLYVAVGKGLMALDAVTGRDIRLCPRNEIHVLLEQGRLILADREGKLVTAYDAATGQELWRVADVGRGLLSDGGRLFGLSGGKGAAHVLRAVDLAGGAIGLVTNLPFAVSNNVALSQVVDGKLILTCDVEKGAEYHVLSAVDARPLWKTREQGAPWALGVGSFPFPCYVEGLIWVGLSGRDPTTGEEKRRLPEKMGRSGPCNAWHGTERYRMVGHTLWDTREAREIQFSVSRGACGGQGYHPANGLLYFSRHQNTEYDMLRGNHALSPVSAIGTVELAAAAIPPLEEGPAFGKTVDGAPVDPGDWPTYRHDGYRGCATDTPLSDELVPVWEVAVGKGVSAPTVAGGRVFVAVWDEHRVVALDAQTGAQAWTFTAGGPVDSPPTIHAGLALFGCRDGWLYCLRAADGALAWRRRAAPGDRKITVREHVESVWPLFGSVLIDDGIAYCSAGRHASMDGGISLYALEPATGEVLWKAVYLSRGRTPGDEVKTRMNDILRSDGRHVYFAAEGYKVAFDLKTGARVPDPVAPDRPVPVFSTVGGLLTEPRDRLIEDRGGSTTDTRLRVVTYNPIQKSQRWPSWQSPWTPLGNEELEKARIHPNSKAQNANTHELYGYAGDALIFDGPRVFGATRETDFTNGRHRMQVFGKNAPETPVWLTDPGRSAYSVRGLVAAGPSLFVNFGADYPGDTRDSEMLVLSAGDGAIRARYPVRFRLRWDGMAASGGRLYVSTEDGGVTCLGANHPASTGAGAK